MSAVIVTIEDQLGGYVAYARQGGREHQANSTSPELAARLAGAELLGVGIVEVNAEEKAQGTWTVTPRHGAFVTEAVK